MNDTRRRDAARSRQALLTAAADLFAERGYAGTAIRSVGDRAGVDPALIARYFGGKEGLYRAVLAADPLMSQPAPTPAADDDSVGAMVRRALSRWTGAGVSAAAQNVFRREIDDAARAATRDKLSSGVLPKLRAAADGTADPELAAQLATALLFGVGVARDAGTLPRLAEATDDELVGPLVAALTAALAAVEDEQTPS